MGTREWERGTDKTALKRLIVAGRCLPSLVSHLVSQVSPPKGNSGRQSGHYGGTKTKADQDQAWGRPFRPSVRSDEVSNHRIEMSGPLLGAPPTVATTE